MSSASVPLDNIQKFIKLRSAIFGIGTAVVGSVFIFTSQAATPSAAVEPENAVLSGNVSMVTDSTASTGKAVKFGSTQTTPPPTTGLLGWQLTAQNVGLAPLGLTCDSLPLYAGATSPAPGTIISGKKITQELDLSNGNVTIEKSCIRPTSSGNRAFINTQICNSEECYSPNGGVIIRDSEFDGTAATAEQIRTACAFLGLGTLQRNYMHGMGSGICFFGTGYDYNALAEQNYVTGLRSWGDSHNEAATIRDFRKNAANTRTAKFLNNRLDCSSGNVTAGLFIQSTWVDIHNLWVTNNYIEGEGYNLYMSGGVTGTERIGNAHATNNRFRSTGWGPAVVDGTPDNWVEWADNYIYDSTKLDGKGALVPKP